MKKTEAKVKSISLTEEDDEEDEEDEEDEVKEAAKPSIPKTKVSLLHTDSQEIF